VPRRVCLSHRGPGAPNGDILLCGIRAIIYIGVYINIVRPTSALSRWKFTGTSTVDAYTRAPRSNYPGGNRRLTGFLSPLKRAMEGDVGYDPTEGVPTSDADRALLDAVPANDLDAVESALEAVADVHYNSDAALV